MEAKRRLSPRSPARRALTDIRDGRGGQPSPRADGDTAPRRCRRNPGTALDLDVVRALRVNRSRRRAPRRDAARAPHGEEGVAGGLAAARDHAHRPHDARRRRHAGQRAPALRQGARTRSATTCSRRSASRDLGLTTGAVCVYHALRADGGRGARAAPAFPSPRCRPGFPAGLSPLRRAASREIRASVAAGARGDRHRHHARATC